MTIEKNLLQFEHPNETSVLENVKEKLSVIFELSDEYDEEYENFHISDELPKCILDFKNIWIFGPTQEKEILPLIKHIYNEGITNCINEIEKEYKSISPSPMLSHLKQLLAKNYIKI